MLRIMLRILDLGIKKEIINLSAKLQIVAMLEVDICKIVSGVLKMIEENKPSC